MRHWCLKFGHQCAKEIRRRQPRPSDTWFLDEVFITIGGRRHYLWRAVDQDGDVLDILVQRRRNRAAAERFFRKVLAGQGQEPRRTVTDGLSSYPPAIRAVLPGTVHDTSQYANNRADNSHQHTRRRERQMQRFKSVRQTQRFLELHGRVGNLFRYGRHLMTGFDKIRAYAELGISTNLVVTRYLSAPYPNPCGTI